MARSYHMWRMVISCSGSGSLYFMRTRPIGIILFVLFSAVLTLAQSTPTGIQRVGTIGLLRAEGKFGIGSAPPVESITDAGAMTFRSINYTNYTPTPATATTMVGSCSVEVYDLTAPSSDPPFTVLDAGPVINLNGPNGAVQIARAKNGGYNTAQLGGGLGNAAMPGPKPLYLDPGTYTIDNGGGGADVGSFTTTLNIVAPGFVWTNADADLTVSVSGGVDIQWSGGDPAALVGISGSVNTVTTEGDFSCAVPNSGEFFVTSDVLSLLPATTPGDGSSSSLSVVSLSLGSFTAPGLDQGTIGYESLSSRNVVMAP
jgi:hypothetical protein